ncbi:MAG: cofactor-independent phosphoglycerate mutase [Planctomycetota bacterium]
MKYAIILPDGAADEPLPELGGRTPLEAAKITNMHWVSRHGRLGRIVTVPAGFIPGTDVATLSLFGYDPHRYYSGRAPLEAAARGLSVRPDQLIFRCNFVTIAGGVMKDYTAGHIAQDEADRLIADLNAAFREEGYEFHSGVSYRNLMLAANAQHLNLKCTPPHDIADQAVDRYWPRGTGAERVMSVMQRSAALLAEHPVNVQRRKEKRELVTNIWLWGQGRPSPMESFHSRFGLSCAVITAVDILRGIAVGTGMTLIHVPGATGYIDTDYDGKGAAAVRALDEFDAVAVHVEAADEAGHLGDAEEKVKALERIDEAVVGPVLDALRRQGEWRMLVAPDHPTPVGTKAHSAVPPPFCYAGVGVAEESGRLFTEAEAAHAGVLVDPGHTMIQAFLGK